MRLLLASLILLTSCGIKGDLIAPKDIPAYKKRIEEREHKLEKRDGEQS